MNLTDFPAVLALSPKEKLELVDEIWRSIPVDLEVSKEEMDLLDKRWSAFTATSENALTIEQFKEQLKIMRK